MIVALALALSLDAQPLLGGEAHGDAEYVLALDPRFGMEGGVRTFTSAYSALMLYDELLAARLPFREDKWWRRALASTGRAGKLFFVDFTLAAMTTILIHEIFGHGARGREAGVNPTYLFTVPPPWRWFVDPGGPAYAGATFDAAVPDLERNRVMVLGGIEANFYTAHWLTASVFERKATLRYSDALLYLGAKSAYLSSFLRPNGTNDTLVNDDVDAYLRDLALRFNLDEDPRRLRRMLFFSYIGNALDPMLWFSAYAVCVRYGALGERATTLPTIPAGRLRLFPTTRYNLTPFGPEHYLDLYGFAADFAGEAYVRFGSSGLAFYGGLGARLFRYEPVEWLSLGAEVDVWVQPQTVFGVRNLYERPLTAGINYGVSAQLYLYGPVFLLGRVAYKTQGYVMGQPLGEGAHGYFGVGIRP